VTTAPERQAATRPASDGFAAARKNMIDSQLRTSGVNDRVVLARMMSVPREDHVPAVARSLAHTDRAVPLGSDQDGVARFMAPPIFYGMLLQEAQPRADDRVLVVDAGSGYLPELVRPLVASVEVITPVQAIAGQGAAGPFSLLLIDGAVEHVPAAIAALLEPDGRAATGLAGDGVTHLAVGRRISGMHQSGSQAGDAEVALLPLAEIGIPVLTEFAKPKVWSF
jgi:protein-L-isoaspartate(D-aspartate) O-methyltransferase